MKKDIKFIASVFMYAISALVLLFYVFLEFTPDMQMAESGRVIILGGSCLFLYFGGLLLSRIRKDNKPMKVNLWIFFILYLILLFTLTFFDPMWGRHGFGIIDFTSSEFKNYLNVSCNFIPFRTISHYISEFNSLYSTRQVLFNLLGNVIALMPMAFFLRLLFEKEKKFKTFLVTVILVVLGIEFTQLITASGRFDVDDIILNLAGSLLMYFIMKTEVVSKLVGNIFLLEKNEISRESLKKFGIWCFVIFTLIAGLIIFRRMLYQRNFDIHNAKYNPDLNIISEEENCDMEPSMFYEDELYKYYLKCLDSNSVYVLANNKDKYLLGDLLREKKKYSVSVDRILSLFDDKEIVYIKDKKYDSFNISYEDNLWDKITVNDEDILTIKYGGAVYNDGMVDRELFLVPKKAGSTTINIDFIDEETDEHVSSKVYEVHVDDWMNVTYMEVS